MNMNMILNVYINKCRIFSIQKKKAPFARRALPTGALLPLLFLFSLGITAHTASASDHDNTDSNASADMYTDTAAQTDYVCPVIDPDGADPFVLKTDDGYLYTKTTGSDICLYRTDSILHLGAAAGGTVYMPGNDLKDLWAPEIWRLDGCWYIYFAARLPAEEMHHMFVLSNPSEDPFEGTWTCSPVEGMDDKFAIDGTILELDNKRYFIWSGWEGDTNIRQDLYLAGMESPLKVLPEKILLSKPELGWETIGDPDVNEGPEVWICKDTVNLVYSASGSWTDDYCLGLLTLDKYADPKNPDNWSKEMHPVVRRSGDVFGPGHNCFTLSEDGSQTLMIYHAARWQKAGWTRNIRFGYAGFDASGKLLPMEPVSGWSSLPVPTGSPRMQQIPLDVITLSEGLSVETQELPEAEQSASAGKEKDLSRQVISGKWKTKSAMSFIAESASEQDCVLTLFVKTFKQREKELCTLGAKVNEQTTAANVYAANALQPVMFPVHLLPGENEIRIFCIAGKADLEILTVCLS